MWAEALLRVLLPSRDRETVSGDLLEEYRDSVRPARSRVAANAWYVGQIAGYLWRDSRVLGLVLLGAWVVSWFLPRIPAALLGDAVFTRGGFAVMLATALTPPTLVLAGAGARASWRAQSAWTGLVMGFFVSVCFAVMLLVAYVVGVGLAQPQLLRFALTPESLRAVALMLVSTTGTGTAVAALGGFAGAAARRIVPPVGVSR
jgi:hypothetical protein